MGFWGDERRQATRGRDQTSREATEGIDQVFCDLGKYFLWSDLEVRQNASESGDMMSIPLTSQLSVAPS